jgi:membrane glycosyltransferase
VTTGEAGKRAGSRRAARRPRRAGGRRRVVLFALAVTLTLVAWGYLVTAAIDFGTSPRSGESMAWLFLGLASLGAVGCLFATLMLATRLIGVLGLTRPEKDSPEEPPPPARVHGGRRAAR